MLKRLGLPGVIGVTLGLALAILAQGGQSAQAFNPATVQCYAPARDSARAQSLASDSLESAAQTALQAAVRCRDSRCEEAPRRELQGKIGVVLSHIRAGGKKSTARAAQPASATPTTLPVALPDSAAELSRVLATLYHDGRLDIAAFGPQRDVLSLLVLNPRALRPCAPPVSRPNVSRYVY